jgi:DNA repair exonuclease SbcCD nuclease subunit
VPGFAFIHASDLHIDSPLVGLDRYDGAPAPEIRAASRRAFENLVRLAIDERVAFVVLAGDVFDGDWRDYNTGVFLNRELARLERSGIRVYLVQGNHDAEGQMTRELRLPPNSHVFSHDAPETVLFAEHKVALHGQSFAEQKVTKNLALDYPKATPGAFNVGVLHTALEGREGHQPYAPCSREDLEAKGYDYWALGHVHRREEVSRRPWIVFPGNLQGRHARETGAKGCTLVTVTDGAVVSARHVPLDVVRWVSIAHDVTGLRPEEIVDSLARLVRAEVAVAGDRLVAARVRAYGRADAAALHAEPHRWRAELVSRVASVAGPRVWLEKVFFDVEPPRVVTPATAENLAVFEEILLELAASKPPLPDLVRALQAKVGGDAPKDDDSPFAPEAVARARADAVEILRWRLRRAGGGRA